MTLIYFILILGIVVLIHEFGHYIMAKKTGVYVYEFSIGMGPRLFKFKRKNDETEYSIRALPLGGYVSLAGEEENKGENVPDGASLQDKSFIQNVLIMGAGVFNNFLLAIFLLFIFGLFVGYTNIKPVIDEVKVDSPAYAAGLMAGDHIIKVNGSNIDNIDKLELSAVTDGEYTFTILRDGVEKDYLVRGEKEEVDGVTTYHIGFTLEANEEKGIIAATKFAFKKFVGLIEQMMFIIMYLFNGKLNVNSLSGPVGIYTIVGSVAKTGIINIVYLTAYISINVGIINIIPFPAFDGGRIFMLIIEKLSRRKINKKVENMINNIGFICLIILMIYVTFNDIVKLF